MYVDGELKLEEGGAYSHRPILRALSLSLSSEFYSYSLSLFQFPIHVSYFLFPRTVPASLFLDPRGALALRPPVSRLFAVYRLSSIVWYLVFKEETRIYYTRHHLPK